MNTPAWKFLRIILALVALGLIIYVLATSWGTMNDMQRFVRIAGLILILIYLVTAILRYRKGSDVSGS